MDEIMEELLVSETPWEVFKDNYYLAQDIRLICFDNNSNNLGSDFMKQDIEKYVVQSFSNMENTLLIDKYNFESYLRRIEVYRCFDFDSNIVGYLRDFLLYKRASDSFKKFLSYIKEKEVQISCGPYILEVVANKHEIDKNYVRESLVSFFAFDKSRTLEEFESFELETLAKDSDIENKVSQALRTIREGIADKDLNQYYLIYCILLKMYEINFKSNKNSKNKMMELIQCVNKELYAYAEQELFLAYLLFSKDSRVNSFFGAIQANSKNVISKIRGMAWDLFHLRSLESQVADRNSNTKQMYMHYFCSRDNGINDILSLNPIKRMIIKDGRCYPLHEQNIFQTEFGNAIYESLNEYKRFRKDNSKNAKLFKVASRYEQSLINQLGK
ncbi:hypothetical protein [Candidatus Enterococcus leclercqii]|uniref:hypothetical protein n=1 Tax=Candidatus Enterococcus leclercqii TaxID=1857218 RepID=UPI00137B5821|nr:hypothetical protein [Enterococcus sp. CU9D]KAF1293512.1 hypothetical protein BAU14_02010 [Enterococcus sp. CU9D]